MTIDLDDAPAQLRQDLHDRAAVMTPSVPPPHEIIERAVRAQRRQRARLATVLGVVALAVIATGVVVRDRDTHVVQSPAANPPQSGLLPADPPIVLDGWSTTYFVSMPGYDEFKFEHGDQLLQVSFYGPDDLAGRVTGETRTTITVHGLDASLLDYGNGRFRADWSEGGRVWEADGGPFADQTALIATLDSIRVVDVDTWKRTLPPGTVTDADRSSAVTALLQGVPVPTGFDVAALQQGPPAMPYYLQTEVLGRVACAWLDIVVTQPGTDAARQAIAALGTAHQWQGLIDSQSEGDYASVLWEIADRAVSGDTTQQFATKSDAQMAYKNALGCP